MTTPSGPTIADFWFDPTCPWAWLTSRWMKEVEQVRDVHVRFHIMSLAYLNRDKQVSDSYRERLASSWGPVRVCAAAAKHGGEAVLDPLYTELGTRFHNQGLDRSRATIEQALRACDLPEALADAMDTDEFDDLHRIAPGRDGPGRQRRRDSGDLSRRGRLLRSGGDTDPARRAGRPVVGRIPAGCRRTGVLRDQAGRSSKPSFD